MLPFRTDAEFPSLTRFLQFCDFFILYLLLLALILLLLPRRWFLALMKIAFPFLPESLEQFREDDHD